MKTFLRSLALTISLALGITAICPAQTISFSDQSFTVANQVGGPTNLVTGGRPFSVCSIVVKATTITTATFGVQASNDGQVSWFSTPVATLLAPTTYVATETVTTVPQVFVVRVPAFTHMRIVLSSTLTATGLKFHVTCSDAHL